MHSLEPWILQQSGGRFGDFLCIEGNYIPDTQLVRSHDEREAAEVNDPDVDKIRQEIDGWVDMALSGLTPSPIHSSTRFLRIRQLDSRLQPHYDLGHPEVDEILRNALTRYLTYLHNLTYNFCLKLPHDPKSPPFADIVAARLADTHDFLEHGELRPASVGVKHD